MIKALVFGVVSSLVVTAYADEAATEGGARRAALADRPRAAQRAGAGR